MSSTDSTASATRELGPVQLLSTSLGRQLLGFLLAVIGVQIVAWAVESPSISATVVHAALGAFVLFNGLYVGGVRFR